MKSEEVCTKAKVHLWKIRWVNHHYSDYILRLISYLWLREHVQTPGAHLAISGDANQVVSILGADHTNAVNWVLQRQRRRAFKRCQPNRKGDPARLQHSTVPYELPLTGESSGQASSCCSCCPTKRSGLSMSPRPQHWGGTWQMQPTWQQTIKIGMRVKNDIFILKEWQDGLMAAGLSENRDDNREQLK